MEIMNCEQYVLGELWKAQGDIAKLEQENDQLQAQCELLESQLNATDPREDEVRRWGRMEIVKKVAYTATPADVGGEAKAFEEWCFDAVYRNCVPNGWKRKEFIDYFEPELREFYNERVKRLEEDEEED